MPATFHIVNFKNKTINWLTGQDTGNTPFGYVVPYNGVQPADPSVTPAGTSAFPASYSYGNNLSARMSPSSGGVSVLSADTAPSNPPQANSVPSLTFARLNTAAGQALMDLPISLVGGGGNMILDSLSSTAGIGNIIKAFTLKLPINNGGTLMFNVALMNRLVDLWTGNTTLIPQLGINTGGACSFNVYSGAAPATADALATGTLLAAIPVGATNIWSAAVSGGAALAAALSVTPTATGTAGYARFVKTYGAVTYVLQGSVGTSGADFILNTLSTTAAIGSLQLVEATITL